MSLKHAAEKPTNVLDDFNITQLNGILKNVKLGSQHLRSWLTHHEYQRLLGIGQLTKEQKKALKADIEEKSGNTARILNTLLTSILGFWIGVSDLMDAWSKPTTEIIFIVAFCVAAAVFIGNLAYRFVDREAKAAIDQIKLANFQRQIIGTIIQHREAALKKLSTFVDQQLSDKKAPLWRHGEQQEDTEQYIIKKLQHLRDKLLESDYQPYKPLLSSLTELLESLSESHKKKQLATLGKGDLQTLTEPNLSAATSRPKKTFWQWLSENKMKAFLDTLPVMVGTAASLFVFSLGVPSAAEKLGFHRFKGLLSIGNVKILAITMTIAITIYFGISQCKFLYRAFKRNAELEATRRKITNAEEKAMRLSNIYNMCMQLKEKLKPS
jgi:hypothetical protein